jgi:type I restriction enzyme S subunit
MGIAAQQKTVLSGYKQTEVGVIPADWDVSTVGREFEIKLGKMLDAEKNVGVPKPYLGNRAVQWDRIDISDLSTVPMTRADMEKFRLRKGDLLVCEGGEVGRAAIWDAPLEECYYQKALHRLRPLRGYEPRLMVALLRQWSDRGLLANYVTQTSIAHLPREKFVEVPMPVPPPPEQRAIAEALKDVDELIDELDELITKKRDLKQAAMQQLLTGHTRLPGFSGKWEVKRLGDLCTLKSGEGITARNIDDFSPFPCYGGNGLRGFTTRYTHDGNYCLIGRVGALCGNLLQVTGQFFASEHAIVATVFENVDVGWLTLALGTLRLNRRAESSAQPVLTVSKLLPLEVAAPATKAEQTAIATVLSDMDAEIAALEQRRDKTRALKQGMMQELLTGKKRLI